MAQPPPATTRSALTRAFSILPRKSTGAARYFKDGRGEGGGPHPSPPKPSRDGLRQAKPGYVHAIDALTLNRSASGAAGAAVVALLGPLLQLLEEVDLVQVALRARFLGVE